MQEIEQAAGLKFTAIINNSNLGEETSAETVLSSIPYAERVAEITGLEIKYTTVKESVYNELLPKIKNLMPLKLFVRQSWLRNEV